MPVARSLNLSRRPRVLLLAEAANPKLYSVSLIGWSFSRALAEVADVHLVSELRNRDDIIAAGVGPMEFTAINNRRWQGLAWKVAKFLRGGTTLGWSTYSAFATLAYPFFEREVWRVFGERLKRGEFDVVHRVTPNAPVVPSLLAKRCAEIGVPFVLGPLNGGVPWPKEFAELRHAEREWLSPLRKVSRLLPGYESTRRCASAILVGARFAAEEMPARHRSKCVQLSENAIDVARFPRRELPALTKPLRVAFVGRFVPLKGVDMLIEAAAPLVQAGQLTLDLIGDGPELPRLQRMVKELGMAEGVEFPGWVDHRHMADRLGRSQVFGFPSVREFGGGVVLEAMACGLVPIVINYGGPGELVPSGTGFALPMASRATLVNNLQQTLARLVAAPDQLLTIAKRAQDHVYQHFTWEAKAEQVLAIYRQVLTDTKI
jgi:glycosyltransferase involved in cell wall biosynthesis